MSASADGKAKGKRKSRIPAGPAGARLVMDELLRRGFDAHLADCCAKKYDVLVGQCGSPPKPVHMSTVHVGPRYVRSSNFVGAAANEVTVHVLLGLKTSPNCASFSVTTNRDMETQLRQPPYWRDFRFIDSKSVERYEDNCGSSEELINLKVSVTFVLPRALMHVEDVAQIQLVFILPFWRAISEAGARSEGRKEMAPQPFGIAQNAP
jgi:hypothetical protein